MKDIKSFSKLFDLKIPTYDHYEYYIKQLSKVKKWSNIYDLVELFKSAENEIDDLFKYKIDKVNEIVTFIKSTQSFINISNDILINDYKSDEKFEHGDNINYLSIDIRMANWVVMKKYDPPSINELGDTYIDLLKKFNVHPVFHESKHFRQFIFGRLNPQKQIKSQRVMIEDLLSGIKRESTLKVECVKNDEIILSFTNDQHKEAIKFFKEFDGKFFKCKIYKIEKVEDFRINHYLDLNLKIKNSELIGHNGHKFFIYLKKYILNEKLDIRDLYFRVDNELAIWKTDELKLSL